MMMDLGSFLSWFSGGPAHRYMPLTHCMDGDWGWIVVTVALDFAVAAGYLLIALHWWTNQRAMDQSPARRALANLRNIFVFCGICGYLFIPIKMYWPAWRLYDLFLAALVYYTWRYAWSARDLKVVFNELGRTGRLAEDLERTREESRQKSFFLNAISHDLRTPLNGLMLNAQLAEMSLESGDRQTLLEALSEVRTSVQATSDMLNGFLELGRLDWSQDQPQPSVFALDELLAQVAQGARPLAAPKGLEVAVEAPTGLLVRTDRARLERIVLNLVENGIKFTDLGGVRLLARAEGDGVVLDVVDTGAGIAPEHRELLFQEFYQVGNRERDRSKGFGLGLAIVRRLATQLGGEISVESELGRGSRFTVALPGALDGPGPGNGRGPSPRAVDVAPLGR